MQNFSPATRAIRRIRTRGWSGLAIALLVTFGQPGESAAAVAPTQQEGRAVAGVVIDDAGRPLANAYVVVLPGGRSVVTDVAGRFRLRVGGERAARLHVSLIGYEPAVLELDVAASGGDAVEVRLRPTPLTLGGIEVTAMPVARAPTAVTQATTQLSGRALERELSGTVASTLRYQPGIAVRFNGPAAALPVLRGLTGDRVLILADGQRTGDMAGSADDHGMTVDPLTAQRVEVVRGPATLLYGNNALGGVVNVISADAAGGPSRPELAVAAQTESAYPGGAVNARAAAPIGGVWGVAARAGVRRTGDMRIGDDAVLGDRLRNTASRNASGSITVSRASSDWTGTATARAYGFAYGIPVPPETEPVDLRGGRLELAARGEAGVRRGPFEVVKLDGTFQTYAHDELDASDVVQQRFELDTWTGGLLVRQGNLGPFREGAWGASVLAKRYAATGPAALTPAADSRAVGAFGFEEVAVGRAAVQVGARVDRYVVASRQSVKFGDGVRRTFDAVSGSVGLSTPLGAGLSGGVTLSRSFRAPTVEELFSGAAHAGTGSVEYGDAGLRAEHGRSVEAVLRLRTGRLSGQFAAYHNAIADYIQPVYQGDTVVAGAVMPVFRYAQAPATLRGVEGSLEAALSSSVLLAVRGDWLHAANEDGTPLSFMPPPRLGVTARWDDGRFALGADVHHELAQRRTGAADEAPTHAHTILRLDAGARIRIFDRLHSLTLRVDNVTDVLHREATSRIKDFAPAAGRNIALGYRVHM
jgi:iron complex outermembrane recepter protein